VYRGHLCRQGFRAAMYRFKSALVIQRYWKTILACRHTGSSPTERARERVGERERERERDDSDMATERVYSLLSPLSSLLSPLSSRHSPLSSLLSPLSSRHSTLDTRHSTNSPTAIIILALLVQKYLLYRYNNTDATAARGHNTRHTANNIHTYIHTYIHVYIYILTCRYTHTARVMESVVVERAAHFAALAARLTNSWVDMKRRKRVVVHMPSISREEAQVPTLLALLVQT
jgi:hypothetical protein